MSFPKLCDICIDHEYYNAASGEHSALQLVPSVESARLIRNWRIIVEKNKNVFSFYGDVFTQAASTSGRKFKSEFKLSFALTSSDPYFFDASNLRPEERDLGKEEVTLKQGNARTVYYFHNNRNAAEGQKAHLSKLGEVSASDVAYLNRLSFAREGLKELLDLRLAPNIAYGKYDRLDGAYKLSTMVDPSKPDNVKRIFEADFSPFGGGMYAFAYTYKSNGQDQAEEARFYLNNQFYGLRPFAVIDLFFFNDIDPRYRPLPNNQNVHNTFYLFIPARRCWWRYRVISKFNRYKNLVISPGPWYYFFSQSGTESNANGEIIFESWLPWPLKQTLESSFELRGTHVETLGMVPEDDAVEAEEASELEEDAAPVDDGVIRRLPLPTVENLIMKKVNGVKKYYCDMFVYI